MEANPANQMARDYLLCFDLLMKDLSAFLKDYKRYHTGAPNRLYAEALLIHLYQKRATGSEIKSTGINPVIVQDLMNTTGCIHKAIHLHWKADSEERIGTIISLHNFNNVDHE